MGAATDTHDHTLCPKFDQGHLSALACVWESAESRETGRGRLKRETIISEGRDRVKGAQQITEKKGKKRQDTDKEQNLGEFFMETQRLQKRRRGDMAK